VLSTGRFEAVCGKCLALSPSITAGDKATAWSDLRHLGCPPIGEPLGPGSSQGPGTRIARACGPNDLWLPCLRIDPHDEERGSRGRPTPERSDLLLDVHANGYANSPYKIDPTGEIVPGTSIQAEASRQLLACQGSHSMGHYEHRGYDCSSRPTLSKSKRQDGWFEMPQGTWTISSQVGRGVRRTAHLQCGRRYRVEPMNAKAERFRGRVGILVAVDDRSMPNRGELLQDAPRRRLRVQLSDLVEIE
jgi:hypothetical protein